VQVDSAPAHSWRICRTGPTKAPRKVLHRPRSAAPDVRCIRHSPAVEVSAARQPPELSGSPGASWHLMRLGVLSSDLTTHSALLTATRMQWIPRATADDASSDGQIVISGVGTCRSLSIRRLSPRGLGYHTQYASQPWMLPRIAPTTHGLHAECCLVVCRTGATFAILRQQQKDRTFHLIYHNSVSYHPPGATRGVRTLEGHQPYSFPLRDNMQGPDPRSNSPPIRTSWRYGSWLRRTDSERLLHVSNLAHLLFIAVRRVL
jgi:hypothetical protein